MTDAMSSLVSATGLSGWQSPLELAAHFQDPLYLLIIPYIVGQPLFRDYVKVTNLYEENKRVCKWIMCAYNLILAAFSLWAAVYMVYIMATELPHGVYGPGHYESETYNTISWWFYISKYVEFLDTYFLILCGRPVIWLQFLHHIGAPLDLGVWHNNQVEGTWIYVVFNGFIHTVMYYYYACCIMKWPFPWKQMITNMQLLQFVSGLGVVIPYAFSAPFWSDPAKRCAFGFNYAYVLMNLTLFINFYRQTYLAKKNKAAKGAKTGGDGGGDSDSSKTLLKDDDDAGSKPVKDSDAKAEDKMNKNTSSDTSRNDEATAARKRKESAMKDLRIWYKGQAIKVTPEWQNKHPGGVKVLRIFHDRDATDVILGMHSDQGRGMVEAMAAASASGQQFGEVDIPAPIEKAMETTLEATTKMTVNYQDLKYEYTTSLYEKLWQTARERGLFNPCPLDEAWKAFYNFGFVFFGMALACGVLEEKCALLFAAISSLSPSDSASMLTFGREAQLWVGLLSMAFGWYQLGWLGHDWSHHTYLPKSNSKNCTMNDWLAWSLTIVRPTSVLSWKLRHNTHHAVTNEMGNDPDIRLSPILHFFEDFDPSVLTALQHVYFVPLVGFVPVLYWHVDSWIGSYKHWSSKNKTTRAHARWDALAMLLHYALIVYPLLAANDFRVLPLLAAYYISGLWSGVIVFASHYGEERLYDKDLEKIEMSVPALKNEVESAVAETSSLSAVPITVKRIGLLEETARTVRNIQSFSRTTMEESFWFWLTGGLNTQFEHHLFPMMPRCNLRDVTAPVKAVCAANGLRFEEDNLKDCVALCANLLRDNVKRNVQRLMVMGGRGRTKQPKEASDINVDAAAAEGDTHTTKNHASSLTSPSFRGSLTTLVKAVVLLCLGSLFSGQSCGFPKYMVPVGIFLSCIALTAVDCVREDCERSVFSPSKTLNFVLKYAFSGVSLCTLATIGTVFVLYSSQTPVFSWSNLLYSLNYFALPLLIMRLSQFSQAVTGSDTTSVCPGRVQSGPLSEDSLRSTSEDTAGVSTTTKSGRVALGDATPDGAVGGPALKRRKRSVSPRKQLHGTPSVDRLVPGLVGKLEEWAQFLDEATRPNDMPGPMQGGLPFARNRLACIPMYRVSRFMKAVENDLERTREAISKAAADAGELLQEEAAMVDGIDYSSSGDDSTPVLRGKNTLPKSNAAKEDTRNMMEICAAGCDSSVLVLGDISPAFRNVAEKTSARKKRHKATFLRKTPSAVESSDGYEEEGFSTIATCSTAATNSGTQTPDEENVAEQLNASAFKGLEEETAEVMSPSQVKAFPAVELSLTTRIALAILRVGLFPVQWAFQKIFLSGDIELYCVVVAYLLMVYVGSFYFAYTPVCIFIGLIAPRSQGTRFLERQFAKLEKAIILNEAATVQELASSDGETSVEVVNTEQQSRVLSSAKSTKRGASSGVYVFGHRLNVFMCFYMGLNHLIALHALAVLFLFGGRDVVLETGDYMLRTGCQMCLTKLTELEIIPELSRFSSSASSPLAPAMSPIEIAPVKWQTLALAFLLWPISGLGITAGAHRLWSHRSYEAHWLTRLFLMLCNSIANQTSIYHWARDHRTHHIHSDTESDPHDSNRGWFYSHVGWLLVHKPEAVRKAGRKVDVSDLLRDALVMFQKKTDPWWNFAWCFAVPAFISVYFWQETLWNGFLFAGVLRYVYVLHCTWSVNSIVHTDFGPSTYDPKEPPSESRLVSILAMGEGWHSWHHAFAFDYATAELDCFQQWNPTKVFIDMMAMLGLVRNRKRGLRMWGKRKEAMRQAAAAEGMVLVESLHGPPLFKVRTIETVPQDKTAVSPLSLNSAKVLDENPSGVSAGELDRIVDIKDWEKTTGLTKDAIMSAIPDRLKKRSALTSGAYLVRDIVYCTSIIVAAIFVRQRLLRELTDTSVIVEAQDLQNGHANIFAMLKGAVGASLANYAASLVFAAFWTTYAMALGTAATGVWVVGHECGHGAFSESNLINDTVGYFTHTLLLVPYFAWQFTHGKHHKYTNHLTMGETHVPASNPTWLNRLAASVRHIPGAENITSLFDCFLHLVLGWPLYLIFNLSGGRTNWKGERLNKKKNITHFYAANSEIFPPQWHLRINLSGLGVAAMFIGLAHWAKQASLQSVVLWYFLPYMVTNGWLVLYTWLQHTHEDVPHFGVESFNWLRGALSTIDRPYPWLIDHLHHRIGSTHVMHHLNFRIPHYHAGEATEYVKPLLGNLYRFDARPVFSEVLLSVTKNCEHVDGVQGVQFYRGGGIANTMHTVTTPLSARKVEAGDSDVSLSCGHQQDPAPSTSTKRMVRSPTTGLLHEIEFPGAPVGPQINFNVNDSNTGVITTLLQDSTVIPSQIEVKQQHVGIVDKEAAVAKEDEASLSSDSAIETNIATAGTVAPRGKKDSKETTKMELLIDGKIVDVTSYIGKHPGGRVLEFMAGTDATDAYNQFHHRSERANKILQRLPQREPSDAAELESFANVGNQPLLAGIRALEMELEQEGFFEPSPTHAAYRIFEVFAMHTIGLALLTASAMPGTSTMVSNALVVLGVLVLAIVQGRCGWLQHEGGHYSLTGTMWLDRRVQQMLYGLGCGMAGSWWRNQHNKHHATPQKEGHDVDLNTLPLVAFHTGAVTETRFGRRMAKSAFWAQTWLKNQSYLFSPLICLLVALFWQLYLHPRHAMRTGNFAELFWMGLRYALCFPFMMSYLGWSCGFSLLCYIVYVQVGSAYIFTNFAVSHTHLATVKADEHRNWAEYAGEHTMNCTSHPGTNWWMAYLNFQIEHHLWPQMPQFRFPQVSPRVRAVFEKHGQEYKVMPYWKAIFHTLKHLDTVANEALEMTGYHGNH
ncbi:unnamed protein product [Amoebophrya sp. A25]|nr:unnamed protein product [Amoebophrya sp. A25]|eukprot:GSA25T00002308001.1